MTNAILVAIVGLSCVVPSVLCTGIIVYLVVENRRAMK